MAPRKTAKAKAKAAKPKASVKSTAAKPSKVEKTIAPAAGRSTRVTRATAAKAKPAASAEEDANDAPPPQPTRATRAPRSRAKLPTPPLDSISPASSASDKKVIILAPPSPPSTETKAPVKRAPKLSARPKKPPTIRHPKGAHFKDSVEGNGQSNNHQESERGKDVNAPSDTSDDADDSDSSIDSDAEEEPKEVVDPTYFDTTGCIPGVDIAGLDDIHYSKHRKIPGQANSPADYKGKVPWKNVWKPETLKARGGNKEDFVQYLTACGLEKGHYDGLDATGLAGLCSERQKMNEEVAKKEEWEVKEKLKAKKKAARALANKATKAKVAKESVTEAPNDKTKPLKTSVKKTTVPKKVTVPTSGSDLKVIEYNPPMAAEKPKRKRSTEDDGDEERLKHPAKPMKKTKAAKADAQSNKKDDEDAGQKDKVDPADTKDTLKVQDEQTSKTATKRKRGDENDKNEEDLKIGEVDGPKVRAQPRKKAKVKAASDENNAVPADARPKAQPQRRKA
ncbi:hypothetical protein BDV96DRAFT_594795 [Lophiotrema nucula]|uniref:Uncharacterized protein n=1 Tax=Lophiotrema nucula TaxID=690887 RepID=A0A6A5ZR42_9PLEO|nr:hypothetical protein BDV96DRAFT_594795 [Lophiotrema nucula]